MEFPRTYPIIDVHTHQPRNDSNGNTCPRTSAHTLLASMDRGGVVRSGVLGRVIPGQSTEEMRESNANTRDVVKEGMDRLYGMVFINPALPETIIRQELDEHLSSAYFRGIKLELDVNCRDPRLDPVMEKAAEYNVPVLHHAWYLNPCAFSAAGLERQKGRSEPHDIAHLARRFPEVRIIMAHMEGCGLRGIIDIAELPNVWIDTSGSLPFTGTLEYAIKELGSQRILFGSDLMGRSLATQLGRIYGASLSPQDLENILYRNAEQLFS